MNEHCGTHTVRRESAHGRAESLMVPRLDANSMTVTDSQKGAARANSMPVTEILKGQIESETSA